jgi:YVTN family beta-propeller protein
MRQKLQLGALLTAAALLLACGESVVAPLAAPNDASPVVVVGPPTHPAGGQYTFFPLTGRPHGVAALPSGRFCVSQIDANTITCGWVGEKTVTFDAPIPVGQTPAHVALSANGLEAYVANQYGSSLSIVDVVGGTTVATVPLSNGGFNVLADPNSSRVYVTTASGLLHTVDATTRSVINTLQLGAAANGLALDGVLGRLYVSSISAATISAVNTADNTIARTLNVNAMPQRIALSPNRSTLYVASEAVGVEVVRLNSPERFVIPGIQPGTVGLALSPDGAQLYVTNPPAGQITVVDAPYRHVLTVTGGVFYPRNVAFALNGRAALVTDEYGRLIVIR